MRGTAALMVAAIFVAGCEQKSYPKDDATAAQYARDEAACRTQMRQTAQNERNIEDQRRATFAGERERYGQQDLYKTMDNQGYKNNVDRMTARCMEARGWAPKNQNSVSTWWNRVSTFNTPK